jgi:hypothetical protein
MMSLRRQRAPCCVTHGDDDVRLAAESLEALAREREARKEEERARLEELRKAALEVEQEIDRLKVSSFAATTAFECGTRFLVFVISGDRRLACP